MITVKSNKINCPVCEHAKSETVYRNTFYCWINDKNWVWPNQIVVCKRCGMIYSNPQPTEAALQLYYKDYLIYGDLTRHMALSQSEFIQDNCPESCSTIFDIGAFDGVFLKIMRDRGWRVGGIEPSGVAVKQALEKYKIQLHHGCFDRDFIKRVDWHVDIVSIRNVLEHIRKPLDFLRLAQKITRVKGYIFLELPDTARADPNIVADFLPMEHIMHFTEGTIRNAAKLVGLKVVKVSHPRQRPVMWVLLQNLAAVKGQGAVKVKIEDESKRNIQIVARYKRQREQFLRKLKNRLSRVKDKKIFIYGAGMHTTQLWEAGLINDFEIAGIVDSDPNKWNTQFRKFKVQNPMVLKKAGRFSVLISSYYSQEEISHYLTEKFPYLTQIKLY